MKHILLNDILLNLISENDQTNLQNPFVYMTNNDNSLHTTTMELFMHKLQFLYGWHDINTIHSYQGTSYCFFRHYNFNK